MLIYHKQARVRNNPWQLRTTLDFINRQIYIYIYIFDHQTCGSHQHVNEVSKKKVNTVDGCEILHQLVDGKHPSTIPYIPSFIVFHSYQMLSIICFNTKRTEFSVTDLRLIWSLHDRQATIPRSLQAIRTLEIDLVQWTTQMRWVFDVPILEV